MSSSTLLQIHFDPSGDLLAAARDCEADVFLRAYGNTREELDEEFAPYEDASAFIALTDTDGTVVAACRLILPSAAGLKSLHDLARPPWLVDGNRSARAAGVNPALTLDIATIGVRPGLRGGESLAAIALYHAIVMASRANNMPTVVMIMDQHARSMLTSIGCATQALPGTGSGPYLGSPASTPVWANVANMMDGQRRMNPDAFRLVSQGIGLDGISVPPLSDFVLRDRTMATSGSRVSIGL
jgi:hypothetical protein